MSGLLLAAWILCGAPQTPPQTAAPAPATQLPEPGKVQLELADGSTLERPASALSLDELKRTGAFSVRVPDARAAPGEILPRDRAQARLAGGELMLGSVRGGKGDVLDFELACKSALAVEVDELRELVFPGRLSAAQVESLEPRKDGDRLYRLNGDSLDRIDGTLESFEAEGVRFESVLGKRTFPWGDVAAVLVLNPAALEPVDPKDARPVAWIDLADGARLRGRLARLDAGGVELARKGGSATVPLAWIEEITLDDGRVCYLSSLEPAAADERSPFGDDLGLAWPHRVDRAVGGAPLTAGGRTWRRGMGVHAPSRLTWKLDGSWKSLRGLAAIDDQVLRLPGKGSVVFRVLVDGKTAWESPLVRGGDAPLAFAGIPLAGAKELVLEVDPAENLHVADRADWLRVVLVK